MNLPRNDHHPNDRGHLCAPPPMTLTPGPDAATTKTATLVSSVHRCESGRRSHEALDAASNSASSAARSSSSAPACSAAGTAFGDSLPRQTPSECSSGKQVAPRATSIINVCLPSPSDRMMADLAVGMVQSIAAEMADRPLDDQDEAIANEALLAPMLKDNNVRCHMLDPDPEP